MSTPQVTHIEAALSDDQIKTILDVMPRIESNKGGLTGGTVDKDYRNVEVKAFDANNKDLEFLSVMIGEFAQTVNDKYYGFDIKGFAEPLQFLRYKKGGRYDSHMDIQWSDLKTNVPNRKLTVITQLSDPKDYEGGDLELDITSDNFTIPKGKGDMIAFPAFLMHKVHPITKGTRCSVVSWLSGDSWK
mgnify:FL=1